MSGQPARAFPQCKQCGARLAHHATRLCLHCKLKQQPDNIAAWAVEYARNGWQVGPLCHSEPTPGTTRRRILGPHGKHPVGPLVPHGFKDFTTDINKVTEWWSQGIPWNIGIRVPETMFLLDVDGPDRLPHPGTGLQALAQAEDEHEPLPATYGQITGSGGLHLLFRRPRGAELSEGGLPKGLEYKDNGGLFVAAPSIHPDSREQYVRFNTDHVAEAPGWLLDMIIQRPRPPRPKSARATTFPNNGSSPADQFNAAASWADILEPHDWECLDADPDADRCRWLHPTATSSCSATIRHGCLFVYSPNTPFDVTSGDNPHGYTKFRAHAILNHNGDMSAAARQLLKDTAA